MMQVKAEVKQLISDGEIKKYGLYEYVGYNYAFLKAEGKTDLKWYRIAYIGGVLVSFLLAIIVGHFNQNIGLGVGLGLLLLTWFLGHRYPKDRTMHAWVEAAALPVSKNVQIGETVTVTLEVKHE